MSNHVEAAKNFLNCLLPLIKTDQRSGMSYSLAAFVCGYSLLDEEHKFYALNTLHMLVREIGHERFEDYADYIGFMKECMARVKSEERG